MIDLSFNLFNIFIFVILLVIYFLFILKKSYPKGIIILRIVLFFLLSIILFKVGYKVPNRYKKINLAIVVDNSYSMKFNGRLEKINELLPKIYSILKKQVNLSKYVFNKDIRKIDETEKIKITNNSTNIKDSLEKIIFENKNLDAILLFTDGNDSYNRYPDLSSYNAKIYLVNLNEDSFNDISIKDIRYSRIGFKGIEHEINCYVLNYGYEGKTINVILETEKEVLDTKKIILKSGDNEVRLKFVPSETGKKKLTVRIENLLKEVTYENNVKKFEVEIKKSKIRILYICGRPSYEYSFLRSLLKNDINIDLVSFVILRNSDSQVIVPDEDLTLIPFPVHDIFVKEINNYDVILFENFSYKKFSIPLQYLDNIKKYVISGGGFIMLGGENSFYLGGYKNTAIEEILPVNLLETEKIIEKEFFPKVNKFSNELLKIYENVKTNEEIWKSVPKLKNYQLLIAKPSAEVLISHSSEKIGENFIPIMVSWTIAKGRVFISATNTTWMWSLGNMLSKNYDFKNLYTQFWKNIIYWAGGATEVKKMHILFDRDEFVVGEVVKVKIVVFGDNYAEPDLWVTLPDLTKKKLNLKRISSYEYLAETELFLQGKYIFSAFLNYENISHNDTKEIYVGKGLAKEIVNLKINEKYLNKLADMSNGKVFNYKDFDINNFLNEIKQNLSNDYNVNYDIYGSPLLIILFIMLFLLEVYIVRRLR